MRPIGQCYEISGQCYEISRHPGLDPGSIFYVEASLLQKWIPAFAGMTEGFAGMTEGFAGMTEGFAGLSL